MSDRPRAATSEMNNRTEANALPVISKEPDTTPKKPRPSWWIPSTLNEALGEQIDLQELYESMGKPIGYRQTWGTKFPIYPENTTLEYYHGLRFNLYAETLKELTIMYGEELIDKHRVLADRISRRDALRILSERIRTQTQFEASRIDPLTGLPNRKAFFERLNSQIEAGLPYGILFVDIDRFKSINDDPNLGHDVGDLVLAQVADRIVSTIRQAEVTMPGGTETPSDIRTTDFAARFGGEEIVVLVSEAEGAEDPTPEALSYVGNRLVTAMNSRKFFTHADNKTPFLTVTASVGGAIPRIGENPMDVLKRADVNLYAAKHGGRNRYVGEGAGLNRGVTPVK